MIRVHVICEGQTEEMFVNEVLAEPMRARGIYLRPSLIGNAGKKGGNFKYERLFDDIEKRLLGDTTSYCTAFFDFYGLPESFPGKSEASLLGSAAEKATYMRDTLTTKLTSKLGTDAVRRFIPYIQMYEFEGLLFSSPQSLAMSVGCENTIDKFQAIRDAFDSPESINNSPQTAPSKRILKLCIGYDKVIHGSLAAIDIGLGEIRSECSLFDAWLTEIEELANAGS
jgi:hypothetical protein